MPFAALFDLRQIFTHNLAKLMVLFADMSESLYLCTVKTRKSADFPRVKRLVRITFKIKKGKRL